MAFNKTVSEKLSTDTKTAFAPGDYVGGVDPDNGDDALKEFGCEWTNFVAVPINSQAGASYTLALSDVGSIVEMDNASANTVTIPTNASVAFPVGTVISVDQLGAGTTTVQGDTGVTLNGVAAGSGAIDGQRKGVSIHKRATDAWEMRGAHGGVS